MKRLLLTSLLMFPTLLAGCSSNKYPSFIEAEVACDEWADEGIKFTKWTPNRGYNYNNFSRECELDLETKQWLGWEWIDTSTNKSVQNKYVYNPQETSKLKKVVEKRFYY